jgi:hypothetical protein
MVGIRDYGTRKTGHWAGDLSSVVKYLSSMDRLSVPSLARKERREGKDTY